MSRLFTRKARRSWWMGRPLPASQWLAILVLSILLTLIYQLWEWLS